MRGSGRRRDWDMQDPGELLYKHGFTGIMCE
jgi:hypothetical protein